VAALAFCPGKILSQKAIFGQKLGQNTGLTEPKRNRPCFLKMKKNQSKTKRQDFNRTEVKYQIAIFVMQAVLSLSRIYEREESPGNIEHPAS
jgi:hypothetical protein